MPFDDSVIELNNVSKTYRIFEHPGDRVKQAVTLGFRTYHRKHTALENICLKVRRGESLGIIGRNGAGKSTLLQILAGVLRPTSGTLRVNGRVSALLELGAGFNPEFTGRENVYFHGAIMGIPKRTMNDRISEIQAFAEIGDFFDLPTRIYSSGMYLRLAFASAIHADADILIVDEALSVGDESFARKCTQAIDRFKERGTFVLVSHDPQVLLKHCVRSVVIHERKIFTSAPTCEALEAYQRLLSYPIKDI